MVLTEVLGNFVLEHFPRAYCPACIASCLEAEEKDVREACQLLAEQPGFGTSRGTCFGCQWIDDIVVKRAARQPESSQRGGH